LEHIISERKPLIGVTTSRRSGWFLWFFAWLSLRWHGARPVRLTAPFERNDFSRLDGLLIGGGDDISATLYGGAPAPDVRVDMHRDELEQSALTMLWETDIPILGICRGAQMLNIYRGGKLHPDIYEVYHSAPKMRTPLPRKLVDVNDGSMLAAIIESPCIVVNALHHQSVEELGEGFEVSARDKHGIIQAIEYQGDAFRIGVQWHPELLLYRSPHRRLFQAFVNAARPISMERGAAVGPERIGSKMRCGTTTACGRRDTSHRWFGAPGR
jgi:putative glutamine amidotransferase